MKKFRAGIVALLALTFAVPLAFSQGDAKKDEVAAKLEKISVELQLTPAQKKQMLPILKEEAPKLEALKGNTSLGPLQKAMQMKEIANETDAKVKPILNPQQYEKWEAMRAEERQKMIQKAESKG